MSTGKTLTHWLILRSHDDPEAEDILAGQIGLGTDGSTVYMTDSDGTVTPINGSAVMKDIVLDDDASAEFQVRESTNTYLKVDTTDGSEVVKIGNSDVATVTAQIVGETIDIDAGGNMTVDAGGTLDLVAVGAATIQGGSLNLGGSGNGDILVGTTGTRDIDIGSGNATEVTLTSSGASLELTATGAEHLVASSQTWTVGRSGFDYLVVDDSATTFQVLSTLVVTTTNIQVTGDVTVTGTVDGVDLSTLASIANGEGCSQLGVEDAGTYYAGADVEAVLQEIGVSLGTIPANLDDLADLNVSGPSDGEVLTWDDGNSEWAAIAVPTNGGAKSEFEPTAMSTEGVYLIHSDLDQEILLTEGARIHVAFAATVVRTGAPAGELRVGLILEDLGGTPTALFATNEDLGGATNIELSGHITLSIGAADSADANERNIYVSGACLREIDGSSIHSSIRKYDGSGHAPVSFPGGLKFADLGTAFDHLRFAVLTTSDAHDASNKYDVSVQMITVDMFPGA